MQVKQNQRPIDGRDGLSMNPEAAVCSLVRETLLESTGWRLVQLSVTASHSRNFSTHMTCRVDREGDSPIVVFVKFVRGITDDRERLEQLVARDHEVTSYLADAFRQTPGIAVPRPIAYSTEHLMLVTEFVDGMRFHDKILRNGRFPGGKSAVSRLEDDCFRCGRWLKAFQDETRIYLRQSPSMEGDDVLGMQTIVHLVSGRLEELHSASVLDEQELHGLLAHVDRQAAEVKPEELSVVGVHGDFFPGNLLIQGATVYGIDFVMFRSGPTYFDATYFVYQLETLKAHPAYPASTIEVLKRAFLKGYSDEIISADIWDWNPLCRILFVMHSAARLIKLAHAPPTGLPRRLLTRARINSTKRRMLGHVRAVARAL